MSEGVIFESGDLFAWGSTVYRAEGKCRVWGAVIKGSFTEVATFELEMDPDDAVKMLEAVGADYTFLVIGSDCGMDCDAPEDDEDEE